jgi:hypothetical protein
MLAIDCFCPLQQKAEELVDYASWVINQDLPWTSYFGFQARPIHEYWIEQEPALALVHKFAPIKSLGLLCVPPSVMYNWHKDLHRKSCINLLISENHHSHTLFGKQRDELNRSICELAYEPKTYYLFNNQVEHCVINLDTTRYLVSLIFENETKYEDLRDLFLLNEIC